MQRVRVVAAALGLLAVSTVGPRCATAVPPVPGAGRTITRVACTVHPAQGYALRLPPGFVAGRPTGIVYGFDTLGRSAEAVARLRDAADELGLVVASPEEARAIPATSAARDLAARRVWEDTHARLSLDPRRVYAAGFSGGARVALRLALDRPGEVAGVVACGGGLSAEMAAGPRVAFALFGAAGAEDFDRRELRALDDTLVGRTRARRLETFAGGHAWCPPEVLAQAWRWMGLLAMRDGAVPRDAAFVERAWDEAMATARQLAAADPLRGARRFEDVAHDAEGLRDVGAALVARRRLLESPAYRLAAAAEAAAAREVEDYRAEVAALLDGGGGPPESRTLDALVRRLRVPALRDRGTRFPRSYAGQAAERVLDALYDDLLAVAAAGDRGIVAVRLANEVRPELPQGWVALAAALAARDPAGALPPLARAVALGFDDLAVLADAPALAPVRATPAYDALVERVKRRPG